MHKCTYTYITLDMTRLQGGWGWKVSCRGMRLRVICRVSLSITTNKYYGGKLDHNIRSCSVDLDSTLLQMGTELLPKRSHSSLVGGFLRFGPPPPPCLAREAGRSGEGRLAGVGRGGSVFKSTERRQSPICMNWPVGDYLPTSIGSMTTEQRPSIGTTPWSGFRYYPGAEGHMQQVPKR